MLGHCHGSEAAEFPGEGSPGEGLQGHSCHLHLPHCTEPLQGGGRAQHRRGHKEKREKWMKRAQGAKGRREVDEEDTRRKGEKGNG